LRGNSWCVLQDIEERGAEEEKRGEREKPSREIG
jgi:hypothetical protein